MKSKWSQREGGSAAASFGAHPPAGLGVVAGGRLARGSSGVRARALRIAPRLADLYDRVALGVGAGAGAGSWKSRGQRAGGARRGPFLWVAIASSLSLVREAVHGSHVHPYRSVHGDPYADITHRNVRLPRRPH